MAETTFKINHRGEVFELEIQSNTTFLQLATQCAEHIGADVEHVSLLILPKPGLIKRPFSDTHVLDTVKPTARIKLIGTPNEEVKQNEETAKRVQAREASRRSAWSKMSTPVNRNRDWKKIQEEAKYTFHSIEPLPYLPNPEKSRRFLERLANDPGIKAAMRKHKFSVGLLTEMNPAEHTTHESRTLGLNRNKGEAIELRLRTDRYDGYRDYKVIRKTLCHELSHNVWSEHDRDFWDLTKELEDEVERNDYHHGGNTLSNQEFYNPDDTADDDHADHGGWLGGEFVLGRSDDASSEVGLSRREIMARAAMSRQAKQKQLEDERTGENSST